MSAQVGFLEKEIAERNESVKLLNGKIADMHKNDFMVNEQLASLRRDYEVATKKLNEYELRQKKKDAAKASGDDRDLPSDSRDGQPPTGRLAIRGPGRPGSRGNPLAPINENRVVPVRAEYNFLI